MAWSIINSQLTSPKEKLFFLCLRVDVSLYVTYHTWAPQKLSRQQARYYFCEQHKGLLSCARLIAFQGLIPYFIKKNVLSTVIHFKLFDYDF